VLFRSTAARRTRIGFRLSAMALEIPVKADQAFAVLQGLEQFRRHARAAEIEILELDTQAADWTDTPACDVLAAQFMAAPK
jgi:hypothetical protein